MNGFESLRRRNKPAEETAIAAWNTRASDRHPYEQRITGDGSDWGEIMRGAYDDLMASACESCTPEQIEQLADYIRAELGSGTLTAEQVREAWTGNLKRDCLYDPPMPDWQAIADELNATLGGGECDAILDESYYKGIHGYCECLKCSNCGEPLFNEFKSCPWCGKRIRKKVDE